MAPDTLKSLITTINDKNRQLRTHQRRQNNFKDNAGKGELNMYKDLISLTKNQDRKLHKLQNHGNNS